jgi:NitT/TauT family transport system substrate-binding protein
VVTGAFEHTLRMQAKGQDFIAVIELGRYPGIALAVRKECTDKLKTIADLKGAKIGVTAPGSSTNMIVWYLMAQDGHQRLQPKEPDATAAHAAPSL